MKNTLNRLLAVVVFAFSLFAISSVANAYCRWVPTHWENGYRVSGHKICSGDYSNVRCKWVAGYWQNGYWHEKHRVCWRR